MLSIFLNLQYNSYTVPGIAGRFGRREEVSESKPPCGRVAPLVGLRGRFAKTFAVASG